MNYWNVGIVTTLKGIMWHYIIVVPFSHFWIGILNSNNNSLVSFSRRSHNITDCYRVLTCLFPLLFSGMRDLAYLTRCRVWITPHWHVKRKAHGLSGLLKWISSTLVVLCTLSAYLKRLCGCLQSQTMTWSPWNVEDADSLSQIRSCSLSEAEGEDRLWSGCLSCDCHLFLAEWFIFSHCVQSVIIDPLLNWANPFANKLWKDQGMRGQEMLRLKVLIKVAPPRICEWQSVISLFVWRNWSGACLC